MIYFLIDNIHASSTSEYLNKIITGNAKGFTICVKRYIKQLSIIVIVLCMQVYLHSADYIKLVSK